MPEKPPDHRIEELAHKHKNGTISPSEQREFDSWYNAHQDEQFFHSEADDTELVKSRVYQPLAQEMQRSKRLARQLLIKRLAVAASIAAILAAGGLVYFRQSKTPSTATQANQAVISPAKPGATLTLANGKKIRLNEVTSSKVATEAGIMITKTEGGQLIYEMVHPSSGTEVNSLTTAKGETYSVRLPDGSLVWLNAASRLTYPAKLNDRGSRKVHLEGEAYFEIAKDKAHPFLVETKGQQIEVLGTSFNIQAYADEPEITTTLLEGSVRVNSETHRVLLSPGEQASYSGTNIQVQPADVEKTLDWKNGEFIFKEQPIAEIMKKLARWYNVQIIFHQDVHQQETFSGQISRSAHISEVLQSLQSTGQVRFRIAGRDIHVMSE